MDKWEQILDMAIGIYFNCTYAIFIFFIIT